MNRPDWTPPEFKDHVLTVLRDDGLYRHLRVGKPGTRIYQFDLVTWPGFLYVGGDIEDYVFSRVADMFDFFGGSAEINRPYWAEKLQAKASRPKIHTRESVLAQLTWCVDTYCEDAPRKAVLHDAVAEAVRRFDLYTGGEIAAYHAVDFLYNHEDDDVSEFFRDICELDLTEWCVHYERALRAIQLGIWLYRNRDAAPPQQVAA